MSELSDTGAGINEFTHIVAGMHIGRMTPEPKDGEMHAVLTVGQHPGTVEEGVKHKHIWLPYGPHIDKDDLEDATDYVLAHVNADRKVLIRSEGGRQRPGLVASYAILLLGGRTNDVIALTYPYCNDFRYRHLITALDEEVNAHLYRVGMVPTGYTPPRETGFVL
jgi:hypothetical protein